MTNHLNAAQVAAYQRDGFVFPVPALSREEADTLRRDIEAFETKVGERAGTVIRKKGFLKSMAVYEAVSHPAILDAVESVLGPNILCWSTSLFVKDPGDAAFVAWHQDSFYWGLEPDDVCSAWIALAPSTRENGAMQVIPATHRAPQFAHKASAPGSANMLFTHEEIAVDVDAGQAVDLLLDQGDMSLHHVKLVHGSPPNRSSGHRYGLAIRYVAPHVRQDDGRATALLVRGKDNYGYFTPDPVPTCDMDPAVLAFLSQTYAPRPLTESRPGDMQVRQRSTS
jgi:non-haem Fe2+, alpha-ketoglutarate-dependent halogenase